MEKKNKFIKLILLISVLISMLCINSKSYAEVSVSQSSVSVNVGQSKTLSLSASDATGTVTVTSSNSAVATVSADNWIDDGKSINIVITGKSAGSATITVSGVVSDNNGQESNYSKPITVTVVNSSSNQATTPPKSQKDEETVKSNIATLSNLGIKPNDFSGFTSSKTSYSVTVPNDVESVEVYAKEGAKGQKISGTGTKKLAEGANTVNVTVTAEDGKTTKTYTINITREKEEQEEEEEEKEEKQEETAKETFGLSELNIENIELQPQFQTDVYEYKVDLTEDIKKLNITTLAAATNSNIEITGNENLQEGENIITIIVKGEDEENTIAYQIIVNKTVAKIEEVNNDNQEQQEKIIMIAIIAGGVILLIIIIAIIVKLKKSKKEEDEESPYMSFMDDYEENEIEENQEDLEEYYEPEPKKKKRSKGKRFK